MSEPCFALDQLEALERPHRSYLHSILGNIVEFEALDVADVDILSAPRDCEELSCFVRERGRRVEEQVSELGFFADRYQATIERLRACRAVLYGLPREVDCVVVGRTVDVNEGLAYRALRLLASMQ